MFRWLILILMGFASVIWAQEKPNIVLITIDTLRADHLGAYGYSRNTSPNIDALLRKGIRFTNARTVEPLTAPALASMVTGIYPHQHGASRNGLPLFPNLLSFSKLYKLKGYRTGAFVANWTLRNKLTGLGEHFETYEEVLTRKRWLGLFLSESDGSDVTEGALDWLEKRKRNQPFLLWVHYVEPHAPYRFQKDFAKQVGIPQESSASKIDRYDTEIAFVDHSIGQFLKGLKRFSQDKNTIIVFASDHGESLGEHNYWGHGRHLYETNLHIPMGIIWEGNLTPGIQDAPATLMDVPSTLLGLTSFPVPPGFEGMDWSPILQGQAVAPMDRMTFYQAHKGAVQTKTGIERGRQKGLLELAILQNGQKEILQVRNLTRLLFQLETDPSEIKNLAPDGSTLSNPLQKWALEVEKGLNLAMERQTELNQTDVEMLRSLGYID